MKTRGETMLNTWEKKTRGKSFSSYLEKAGKTPMERR
jgi:hypothetical protein